MEPLFSLFRIKPQQGRSFATTNSRYAPAGADTDWCESGWSVHDSTNDLLKGVLVIEHPGPDLGTLIHLMTVKRPAARSPKTPDTPDLTVRTIINSPETESPAPR